MTTSADAPRTTAPPAPALPLKAVIPSLAVLVVSAFLMILNETVLSVALPNLMRDFAISATTGQWLTTGFMLTLAIVIPTTGALMQRFSVRGLLLVALAFFAVGTIVAALAPSFPIMMAARVVQALGTAIIMPLLMTTTLNWIPVQHRGTAMGLNAVVISVGPALGPTFAGFVMNASTWHAIFWIMLPLAIILFVAAAFGIRLPHEPRPATLDALSIVLAAFGFGGVVYALSSIGAAVGGTGSVAPLLVSAVVGIVGIVLFALRQVRLGRERGAALLDLRPFAIKNFRRALAVIMIAMASMLGSVVVLPILLQDGRAVEPVAVGLMMLPGGLIQAIASPIIGRLYDRVGPRPLVIPGALVLAAGQWLLFSAGPSTPVAAIIAYHVVFCLGMAAVMSALMTASLSSLPHELYAHGSAILNTMQQLAGAAGTALLVTGMSIGIASRVADGSAQAAAVAEGAPAAFLVGGILSLVAVVVAPFIRRP